MAVKAEEVIITDSVGFGEIEMGESTEGLELMNVDSGDSNSSGSDEDGDMSLEDDNDISDGGDTDGVSIRAELGKEVSDQSCRSLVLQQLSCHSILLSIAMNPATLNRCRPKTRSFFEFISKMNVCLSGLSTVKKPSG